MSRATAHSLRCFAGDALIQILDILVPLLHVDWFLPYKGQLAKSVAHSPL